MEENTMNLEQESGQESTEQGAQVATYTEDQMMSLLQKETDRRVTAALQKQQAKFEAKLNEAEKLRGMNEEQKATYEFEQKVKQFEEREREFNLVQNKYEAQKILAEKGLPLQMVEYIVADDAETMMDRIASFEQMFNAAVNDTVSKRIASPTPKAAGAAQTGMTKERFKSLSLAEQAEIYRTNPNLYKQLV